MSDEMLWEQLWGELRDDLNCQPRCPEHPQFPCVRTLRQEAVNDILRVDQDGIRVRSHRTGNEDVIPASSFRAWWVHLQQHGTAALTPGDPNCPHGDRAVPQDGLEAGAKGTVVHVYDGGAGYEVEFVAGRKTPAVVTLEPGDLEPLAGE